MSRTNSQPEDALSRRAFLRRAAKAGVALATLGYGAARLRKPPAARPAADESATKLPDYRAASLGAKMAITEGADRSRALAAAIAALGGIRAFIAPGDRVLLKVNAAFATPPALGATTHPELVKTLALLCFEAGAAEVMVTDHPIHEAESCFRFSGIGEAARDGGARLWTPSARDFRPFTAPGSRLLRHWPVLLAPLEWATKLIGMAPLKDHARAGASLTLKNWYGFIGGPRAVFHQSIHEFIADLAGTFRPTFVVLDGTTTMYRNGPTGGSLADLRPTHRMIVSTDPVAADAFGATLLDRPSSALPFLEQAAAQGAGTVEWERLDPIRVRTT
jgi:uncharacterized protein (DUF362 family)